MNIWDPDSVDLRSIDKTSLREGLAFANKVLSTDGEDGEYSPMTYHWAYDFKYEIQRLGIEL